ncbi:MAG: polysaccharide pyruvyl transferase family protein [Clostridia bacterium]|nr:polysaccharide pyruvyl transferase family protein [Clostridia bacterium]
MKKVGLITYYGNNYGGMLQAYALQRVIKQNGYECKIISNDFLYTIGKFQKMRLYFRKLSRAMFHLPTYIKKGTAIRKHSLQNEKKNDKFREFLCENIEIDKTGYTSYRQYLKSPPLYDTYITGSDQIWNPNLYMENGFYFADFAPQNLPRISYASSIGVSGITKKQEKFIKPLLERMDIISTREESGAKIVESITDKKARVVLDPTLLLNCEEWSEVANRVDINEPYVFVYMFGEREYYEEIKRKIKELTGLKLVCIPYTARELESDDIKICEAGPSEFIGLIKNASLVLTDSFHATVFSINLKTPFLSLCRFSKNDKKGMNSRLHTILSTLDLESRLIDENDEINESMIYDVDFEKAHVLLNEKRKTDTEFLLKSLEYERE